MFNKEVVQAFADFPTPFYYYDLDILQDTLDQVKKYGQSKGYHIHYALKANYNDRILNVLKEAGLGADCVSGNEVKKALEIGFLPNDIVFAGVGKTDDEIRLALENDIFCFNCESLMELEVINDIASEMGKIAGVALRINPNVKADTHKYITTGLEENKFGINIWELEGLVDRLAHLKYIKLIGIHTHIGSQIHDITNYEKLCIKINELQDFFIAKGIVLEHINVGGGLGINYTDPDAQLIPDFKSYFEVFSQFLKLRVGQQLHFELGRSIVGQCGTLISRVLYIKNGIKTDFAIIDAGMTELIRPALYQAIHRIENISSDTKEKNIYDVVGPVCESSDCFVKGIELPITKRGDLIAIRSSGAYGEVMSSNYNLRDKAKAYYSDEIPSLKPQAAGRR